MSLCKNRLGRVAGCKLPVKPMEINERGAENGVKACFPRKEYMQDIKAGAGPVSAANILATAARSKLQSAGDKSVEKKTRKHVRFG